MSLHAHQNLNDIAIVPKDILLIKLDAKLLKFNAKELNLTQTNS